VLLAGVAVFGILQFVRPEVSPGSREFENSSAYQRIVLGSAGLEIFEENPVIGAGWRESGSPKVIGARSLNITLRRRFPETNPIFYPDVTPTSVHNTYIQILADLGLIGFCLFLALIVTVGAHIRRLLRRLGRGHELWPQAWVMTLGLVLVLVWLNDNPLYGGQPETVLTALLVGSLAAISRIAASD
jgi:O-antigen ligase